MQTALADEMDFHPGLGANPFEIAAPVLIGQRVPAIGQDDSFAGHPGTVTLHVTDTLFEHGGKAIGRLWCAPVIPGRHAPPVAIAMMPGRTKILLDASAKLPFQRHEPGHGITGIGGFTGITVDRTMKAAEQFAQLFDVQFAVAGHPGDVSHVFAYSLRVGCSSFMGSSLFVGDAVRSGMTGGAKKG